MGIRVGIIVASGDPEPPAPEPPDRTPGIRGPPQRLSGEFKRGDGRAEADLGVRRSVEIEARGEVEGERARLAGLERRAGRGVAVTRRKHGPALPEAAASGLGSLLIRQVWRAVLLEILDGELALLARRASGL